MGEYAAGKPGRGWRASTGGPDRPLAPMPPATDRVLRRRTREGLAYTTESVDLVLFGLAAAHHILSSSWCPWRPSSADRVAERVRRRQKRLGRSHARSCGSLGRGQSSTTGVANLRCSTTSSRPYDHDALIQ